MRSNLRIAMLAAAYALCGAACARDAWAQALTVKSPDGKLVVTFSLKSLPAPYAPGIEKAIRESLLKQLAFIRAQE